MAANYALKETIREYWGERAESFDLAFGHRMPPGPERDAWEAEMARCLGAEPLDVLDVACGTGEVTGALRRLGHCVTGLDFSEAMLARAKAKHAGDAGSRFLLADAEHTREPGNHYGAVVCRHLVWTLTDPQAALDDWFRVLKPCGHLLVFDGDFSAPGGLSGRLAKRMIGWLDRIGGTAPPHNPLVDRHAAIMGELPFAGGLTFEKLRPMAEAAGFTGIACHPHDAIARSQRRGASLRERLQTRLYRRFILHGRKPG